METATATHAPIAVTGFEHAHHAALCEVLHRRGRQGIEDTAIGDFAAPTLADELYQFVAQFFKIGDLPLDIADMVTGQHIDLGTRTFLVVVEPQ